MSDAAAVLTRVMQVGTSEVSVSNLAVGRRQLNQQSSATIATRLRKNKDTDAVCETCGQCPVENSV